MTKNIENEILMHLRSLKKTWKDVSLHEPIGMGTRKKVGTDELVAETVGGYQNITN